MSFGYESPQRYDFPPRRVPPPPRGNSPTLLILVVLLGVLLGVLAYRFWPFGRRGDVTEPDATPREVTPRGKLWDIEQGIVDVAAKASKSVVHIRAQNSDQDSAATGSGFIYNILNGKVYVVTNFHVIENVAVSSTDGWSKAPNTTIEVTPFDQKTYQATIVGGYPDKDIAVLYVRGAPADKFQRIDVGTSDTLKVGQFAFAIGSPYGLSRTLTWGIVSALGREITTERNRNPIKNVIQTDAPINPGNSGGPLLDSAGRLIGMNTAIFSPSGSSAGIGFAIPVDEINQVATAIIKHGRVIRPFLGVHIAPDQLASQAGVEHGALIWEVVANSPAARAGLRGTTRGQLGDIIVKIDDKEIERASDLFSVLGNKKVGDKVTLTYSRNDKEQEVTVTLE
ncbi:MAG: trypsin-like peptidase domain-containing protein [Planctomycetes bacterium]|nr:trypsin-like peptidase domain-containing protein [Planctomycetota bacterium]